MNDYSHSTERSPREVALFAIGFLGFGMAAAGIVLTSAPLALIGAVTLFLVVCAFRSSNL